MTVWKMKWREKMGHAVMQTCSNTTVSLQSGIRGLYRSCSWGVLRNSKKKKVEAECRLLYQSFPYLCLDFRKIAFSDYFWIWNSVSHKNLGQFLFLTKAYWSVKHIFQAIPYQHDLIVEDISCFFWANILEFCPSEIFTWHPALTLKCGKGGNIPQFLATPCVLKSQNPV